MGMKIQTIRQIRLRIQEELRDLYPEAEISALTNLILKTIIKDLKLHQIHEGATEITGENYAAISQIVCELKKGKPIQYIIGHTIFYNCTIEVNSATLIPRQETEELVDLIIRENPDFRGTITDIGTGSGCIAIALAANLPGASVTATDISAEALETARRNALINRVNITFLEDDILEKADKQGISADIIVSNPPYIRHSEKKYMHRNVLEYEPAGALFVDDSDPLKYYRAILTRAEKWLASQGKIYFEINEALGCEMSELMNLSGYSEIIVMKDLNGKDRIVKGRKNG